MMKYIVLLSFLPFSACTSDRPAPEPASAPVTYTRGTMTDPRDGQIYPTVTVGGQTWMARNLDFGGFLPSVEKQSHHAQMADDGTVEKYCYFNKTVSCSAYGGLYEWHEAMAWDTAAGARGVCPDGWHIPTDAEVCILETALGMDSATVQQTGYRGTYTGTALQDTAGFAAQTAGIRNLYGGFTMQGRYATFWTSSKAGTDAAWYRGILYGKGAVRRDTCSVWFGKCVRCVRDVADLRSEISD